MMNDLLLLSLIVQQTFGFNLNVHHVIVYEDAHKQMGIATGEKTLFGYTTLLYPGNNGNNKPWILIGAPKGSDLSIPAQNPGVVFKCGIKQQCDMLSLDRVHGENTYNGLKYIDCRDNAWFGGSMDINVAANLLVICGFRWANNFNIGGAKSMIGACYLSHIASSRNTSISEFEMLLPLLDPGKASYRKGNTVYWYFLGEAGFSSHITNTKANPQLLLGAPGLFNWGGGTIAYSHLDDVYSHPPKVNKQQLSRYSLFGYAVSSGRYTDTNDILFASSKPTKDNYLGTVLVYKFGQRTDMDVQPKHILRGSQVGEYFGAALTTGDLNNDGYDDLIVGAPFYSHNQYNDGRVHIFYGGKQFGNVDDQNGVVHVYGSGSRGHFGAAVSYVGDLNLDGYGDLAVGAPYTDSGRGAVYIYQGSRTGLVTTPSQILEAKTIDLRLKGFGISVSNGADIDSNGYSDIAIGSHLSGHTVLIRSHPIVTIESNFKVLNGNKINILGNTTIVYCYNHTGSEYMPKHISVERTLKIDEHHQRVLLAAPTNVKKTFILKSNCETFVLTTKEKKLNLIDPVKISVSYELVAEAVRKSNYYVGLNNTDTFCKTCPILSNERPHEAEFSYALNCGDDNVCMSNLHFDAIFSDVSDNWFVIGSSEHLRMDIQVTNSGDSAYLTQVHVHLPEYVQFESVPKKCSEDEHGKLTCLVGNPLKTHEFLTVFINVKDVRTDLTPILKFNIQVTTSSENKNPEISKDFVIQLKNVVDLVLMGKSVPPLQLYQNNATFIHVYEIQNVGKSPAEYVTLTMHVPTHILHDNVTYPIVKFYSVLGTLSGQPILCRNNSRIEYLIDTSAVESDTDEIVEAIRKRREVDSALVYTNNLNQSNNPIDAEDEKFLANYKFDKKALTVDCLQSTKGIVCSSISCHIRLMKSEHDVGVVRIKALLDTDVIKQIYKIDNEIVLSAFASVDAAYVTDDKSNNDATITSIFRDEIGVPIALWIVICAAVAGLLLLMLIICALYKAGFFARKKKLQMEEEKKQAESLEPTQLCLLDFQLARIGSPALDLSYFIFTCTDRKLREKHYDELMQIYHDSMKDALSAFSMNVENYLTFDELHEQMRKFSVFGIHMTIAVTHLMLSEQEEIPDFQNIMSELNREDVSSFHYVSKNESRYRERIRGVILDCVDKGYL